MLNKNIVTKQANKKQNFFFFTSEAEIANVTEKVWESNIFPQK